MENSKNWGKTTFTIEKGQLVLEFKDFNGLMKGTDKIENFIKHLKAEVSKFKRWEKYQKLLTNHQLEIENI